ncbi:exodeoxyribonuclease V subunit alpha [bacterium]|nr:MAG: exodeoxyribonuclease V subunit alpha [bacterium]
MNGEFSFQESEGAFSPLARRFADLLLRLSPGASREAGLAAMLVSREVDRGNVCVELKKYASTVLENGESAPPFGEWTRILLESGVAGEPGEWKPLILDAKGRLYLRRYHEYETSLARFVGEGSCFNPSGADTALLKASLGRLFPASGENPDLQRVAALVCATRRFSVISGGPGTGKTHTVVKALALILELNGRPLKIAVCAPTGKAAGRLGEAIRATVGGIDCPEWVKNAIPREVFTLHRLLGFGNLAGSFAHGPENTLAHDLVVVDEASMVDLPLMAHLAGALKGSAKLMLVGDRDQLASVEAGAVLGDICGAGGAEGFTPRFAGFIREVSGDGVETTGEGGNSLSDAITILRKSYRFKVDSGIGECAGAVNRGDGEGALALLSSGSREDAVFEELPPVAGFHRKLSALALLKFEKFLRSKTPGEALAEFSSWRVLCALRKGPYGVEDINSLIERALSSRGLIDSQKRWYAGRPVLITRNDYNAGLFNGDVGVTMSDPEAGGELRVFFQSPGGGLRGLHPARLGEHETVFAMTVHKSQGSEFEEILLVLPPGERAGITRELLYTAMTRAKRKVEVWGEGDSFVSGVKKRVERSSGLRDALWG